MPVFCTVAICNYGLQSYFTPDAIHTDFEDMVTGFNLSATPPTVTPEPSSFLLLGTGALSFAAAARRRCFRN